MKVCRRLTRVAVALVVVGWSTASLAAYETDLIKAGNKALEQMQLQEAKAKFEQALASNYQVPKAKYGLAEVMLRSGRYPEAEQLYREALEAQRREGGKELPEARAGLGVLLIENERWDEGAREVHAAYQADKNNWPANYGEARIRIRDRKWDEAKSFLDNGKGRKGAGVGQDLYHRGMAFLYVGMNDLKSAENEAIQALHANPADPRHGMFLAQIYEKRDVPDLAVAACEEVLRTPGVVPTASFVHFTGTLYQKAGRYSEARDQYLRAVEIDSTYTPVLKDLGGLLSLAKQYDRAAQVYMRYVQQEPDDVEGMVGLAAALNDAGRNAQALETATQAMQVDSTRADVRLVYARAAMRSRDRSAQARGAQVYASLENSGGWKAQDRVLLAGFQIERNQLDAARRNLNSAVALDSTYADAYFQMGLLCFKTNNPDSAVGYFEHAIRLEPKVPLYYLNLGVAHFQSKRYDQAMPVFQHAIELDSRLVIGYVLLGQVLVSVDSLSAAEAQYKKALAIDPKNSKALRGLGFCYLRNSSFSEASEAYESATEADPNNVDGWVGLGQAHLGLQNWSKATSAFRQAQAIDPDNPQVQKGMEALNRTRQTTGG
jgi:tetratricopeptide (TPR) repeat protein